MVYTLNFKEWKMTSFLKKIKDNLNVFVQLGPSPNPKPKSWVWTKANTKLTFKPPTTHHHPHKLFSRRDFPRLMKILV
jgi:hypothetical protein